MEIEGNKIQCSVAMPKVIVDWLQQRADRSVHTVEAEVVFLLGAIKNQLEAGSTRFLGEGVIQRGINN
jgi:hypothetical protein